MYYLLQQPVITCSLLLVLLTTMTMTMTPAFSRGSIQVKKNGVDGASLFAQSCHFHFANNSFAVTAPLAILSAPTILQLAASNDMLRRGVENHVVLLRTNEPMRVDELAALCEEAGCAALLC